MVSFGKWRLGLWYERTGKYTRTDKVDRTFAYQALQVLRRHPRAMAAMRRLLTRHGLESVFRLPDGDAMRLLADRLTKGEICLFEATGRTLQELWDATVKTPIAAEFLEVLTEARRPVPSIHWGKPEYRSQYDAEKNEIVLDQHFQRDDGEELSDSEWQQAIAMELGNAVNDAKFREMLKAAIEDPPSRDDFTAAVERLEFETRMRVIKAYNEGEFCRPVGTIDCISLFDQSISTFANFLKDPKVQQHRNQYARVWDQYCRQRYQEKKG